jgi:hypothetical protein
MLPTSSTHIHLPRFFTLLTAIALAAALSGCATPQPDPLRFRTFVTSFHRLGPTAGLTYTMLPFREQDGSLEYGNYAQQISDKLKGLGMVEVSDPAQAAVAVFIRFGIDSGSQVTSTYPVIGQTGVASSFTTGTVNRFGNTASVNTTTQNIPSLGVVGTGTDVNTVFRRYLDLEVVDAASLSSASPKKLYEGKARSTGSSPQLARVMPFMVRSIFLDFPGPNSRATEHNIEEQVNEQVKK